MVMDGWNLDEKSVSEWLQLRQHCTSITPQTRLQGTTNNVGLTSTGGDTLYTAIYI